MRDMNDEDEESYYKQEALEEARAESKTMSFAQWFKACEPYAAFDSYSCQINLWSHAYKGVRPAAMPGDLVWTFYSSERGHVEGHTPQAVLDKLAERNTHTNPEDVDVGF